MKNLKIAVIQSSLYWHNPDLNKKKFEDLISNMDPTVHLVILPEMFTTGFSMNAQELAEHWEDSETRAWLINISKKYNKAICGSFIAENLSQYFNRLVFVNPDGEVHFYDKKHLFRMAKEDEHYTSGHERCIVEYMGWKICPLVCYDLRFPVWSRNKNLEYDLLIYVANWPERRSYAWQTLLKARAIENLSYVAAANRIGADGNGVSYNGCSSIIKFDGEVLKESINEEKILYHTLSKEELEDFRNKFPAHLDADSFHLLSNS